MSGRMTIVKTSGSYLVKYTVDILLIIELFTYKVHSQIMNKLS